MTTHRHVTAGILLVVWVVAAAARQNQGTQFDGVALTTTHTGRSASLTTAIADDPRFPVRPSV